MLDSIFLRLTVLVVAIVLVATVWSSLRRRLPRAHRFLTDYTLAMYGLTYAAGCCVLYLFRYDYLFRFYGNAVFFPTFTSFELVLFLGLLPFLVLPIMVAGILALTRGAVTHLPEDPIGTEAKTIGLALVLLPSLALIAPIAGQLMSNALGDLLSTSSATSLYTQRALVFEQVSFLQGGVIYSVLPAVAAILLFWQGQHPWMSRVLGAGIALIATLLNLGMFQIGPTLSFFLTCTFCYIVLRGGRISLPVAGGALFLGSVVLGFYSLLKTSANNINQIEIFLMRLPMPLPYLIQFAAQKPALDSRYTSLPFDLGEYMFPELRSAQRFVAMPQPAFIDAWFSFNPLTGIAVLLFGAMLIVFFGNRMVQAGFGQPVVDPRLLLWAVIAAPSLYYLFQVDILSLMVSAYSIPFVALAPVAIMAVHLWTKKADVPVPSLSHHEGRS
ncbi:hypothetical protein AVM11_17925 [Sphingomonas melonis TY]|uniref:Uncharacterized protein n=1 Tax=Sphingomonas melonis TY TaxID=621456 RepID=A0A175Y2L6_9SPHN|nr:hypothetical protein [Sphingomonas melonis]AOW24545.1 hypothetical protein BJP26_14005 [Sphingomonas melonis TY]KZB95002.1 hypothetical protein AVM11_17925 [Sphingomonas melonis TY]